MLFSQIRQYVKGILANSFINKSTLDKLGENNNGLTFNGNNIEPPQELTSQQMQDIKDAFVVDSPRNGYPVLFDETGAEHFVGWYKYANGTRKPMYEKSWIGTCPALSKSSWTNVSGVSVSNYDYITVSSAYLVGDSVTHIPLPYSPMILQRLSDGQYQLYTNSGGVEWTTGKDVLVTLRYTKTTDTPQ